MLKFAYKDTAKAQSVANTLKKIRTGHSFVFTEGKNYICQINHSLEQH